MQSKDFVAMQSDPYLPELIWQPAASLASGPSKSRELGARLVGGEKMGEGAGDNFWF